MNIEIHGPIAPDAARHVIAQLQSSHAGKISVSVNSEGGDAGAALQISRALQGERCRGRIVETIISGLAASAASVVSCAGSLRRIASDGLMMIHMPRVVDEGSAPVPITTPGDRSGLDRIIDDIVDVYHSATGLSTAKLRAMMEAETWMSSSEAIGFGFATDEIAGLRVAASLSSPLLGRLVPPARYRARFERLVAPRLSLTAEAYLQANAAHYGARGIRADAATERAAKGRPPSFADLAREVYGVPSFGGVELIATSPRGGGQ